MNNKGQSILAEHVMVFFIVMAALIAITVFVRRAIQARIHEAQKFTIDSVRSACDANCVGAATSSPYPGWLTREYEPYYMQSISDVLRNSTEKEGATSGSRQALGAKYLSSSDETVTMTSAGFELPPICSGPDRPPCCSDGSGCVSCHCSQGQECGPDSCGNPKGCDKVNALCVTDTGHYGCDVSTGQCYACACPTSSQSTLGGICPSSYIANCGPDTCGHAGACGTCTAYNGTNYTSSCLAGRCWVPNQSGPGENCANCQHPCL